MMRCRSRVDRKWEEQCLEEVWSGGREVEEDVVLCRRVDEKARVVFGRSNMTKKIWMKVVWV